MDKKRLAEENNKHFFLNVAKRLKICGDDYWDASVGELGSITKLLENNSPKSVEDVSYVERLKTCSKIVSLGFPYRSISTFDKMSLFELSVTKKNPFYLFVSKLTPDFDLCKKMFASTGESTSTPQYLYFSVYYFLRTRPSVSIKEILEIMDVQEEKKDLVIGLHRINPFGIPLYESHETGLTDKCVHFLSVQELMAANSFKIKPERAIQAIREAVSFSNVLDYDSQKQEYSLKKNFDKRHFFSKQLASLLS